MAKAQEVLAARLVSPPQVDRFSRNLYSVPVAARKVTAVAHDRSPAHVGGLARSIDFYVPEGTIVYAAEAGRAVYVRDSNKAHGIDITFWDRGNMIAIEHPRGELTDYEHLSSGSAMVHVGDRVYRGQAIALSGNTGFTEHPHLHFSVLRTVAGRIRDLDDYSSLFSVRARFKDFPDVYNPENYADVLRSARRGPGRGV